MPIVLWGAGGIITLLGTLQTLHALSLAGQGLGGLSDLALYLGLAVLGIGLLLIGQGFILDGQNRIRAFLRRQHDADTAEEAKET